MKAPAPLAMALDTGVAIALVAVAAAFLLRRAVRTFSARRAGGCGCPNESVCGPKGPASADFSSAAARAVKRLDPGAPANGSAPARAAGPTRR